MSAARDVVAAGLVADPGVTGIVCASDSSPSGRTRDLARRAPRHHRRRLRQHPRRRGPRTLERGAVARTGGIRGSRPADGRRHGRRPAGGDGRCGARAGGAATRRAVRRGGAPHRGVAIRRRGDGRRRGSGRGEWHAAGSCGARRPVARSTGAWNVQGAVGARPDAHPAPRTGGMRSNLWNVHPHAPERRAGAAVSIRAGVRRDGRCAARARPRWRRRRPRARWHPLRPSDGHVIATAAAGQPAWSRTAAATERKPGVTSPSSLAKPAARTWRRTSR